MRFTLAFLALWLGVYAPLPVHAASAADAILVQANAALTSGQYQTAQVLAASGLAEVPLDAPIRNRLLVVQGLAQQAVGETDAALVHFNMALQGNALTGEERAQALFARGLTLDTQGRLDQAIVDYTAALNSSPRASYALNNRANVYRRQGRVTEARRDYVAALEASTPTPQYPWYGLGQIAEAQGDVQAARSYYDRALAADPGFALARARLKMLGTPVEGLAGIPADTDTIVLRAPGTRPSDPPVVLKPPGELAQFTPAVTSPTARPAAIVRVAQPARPAQARPGQGAPLRPAIVDGVPGRAPMAGAMVQLGAWRSEAEARDGWIAAQKAAGGPLAGLEPVIVTADLPGRGRFYRLRVRSPGAATPFCTQLEAAGLACLPVRD